MNQVPTALTDAGTWSPGPSTNAPLKQHRACIPDSRTDRGKYSESPEHPYTCTNRQTHITLFPSFQESN